MADSGNYVGKYAVLNRSDSGDDEDDDSDSDAAADDDDDDDDRNDQVSCDRQFLSYFVVHKVGKVMK